MYTRKELNEMSIFELRDIGKKYNLTGRSKKKLIEKIFDFHPDINEPKENKETKLILSDFQTKYKCDGVSLVEKIKREDKDVPHKQYTYVKGIKEDVGKLEVKSGDSVWIIKKGKKPELIEVE